MAAWREDLGPSRLALERPSHRVLRLRQEQSRPAGARAAHLQDNRIHAVGYQFLHDLGRDLGLRLDRPVTRSQPRFQVTPNLIPAPPKKAEQNGGACQKGKPCFSSRRLPGRRLKITRPPAFGKFRFHRTLDVCPFPALLSYLPQNCGLWPADWPKARQIPSRNAACRDAEPAPERAVELRFSANEFPLQLLHPVTILPPKPQPVRRLPRFNERPGTESGTPERSTVTSSGSCKP